MSYATTARRPNPLAAFGALGVPASVGAILVIGLAVNGTIKEEDPGLTGVFVPVKPEVKPEPLPEPTQQTQRRTQTPTPIERPAPLPMPFPEIILSGDAPLTIGGDVNEGWGSGLEPLGIEVPEARPTPRFDPIKASPRGNPGNWITTADYKTSWIRRGYSGTARFSLEVSASGRVNNCTITGSTGHEALDRATCRLIQARAVFNPAKGTDGGKVAGTFSSSVNWTIPQ